MDDLLKSDYWYLVDTLTPKIASHAVFQRQKYRGEVVYILQDSVSGQFLRLNYVAYVLVNKMNGELTVDEIWHGAGEYLKNDLPHQRDVLQLIVQLRNAGLLHGNIQTDVGMLSKVIAEENQKKAFQRIKNPMGIRVPIWDPDIFLNKTASLFNPFFSKFGLLIWGCIVMFALTVLAQNFDAFFNNISDRVFSGDSLMMMIVLYPIIKAFHEMGHAYAVKKWGGEVHEIGIMFIIFFPVPYVDATASWAFKSKYQRALVASMGVIIELLIAAFAIIVWSMAEPGLLRATAYSAALTAGISTLIFNGNPLLRFDGYYVFCDLVEMPNLGPKSIRHLQYLLQRYVLGNEKATVVSTDKSEVRLFTFYGIASLIYRLIIMVGILAFVASKFFFLGMMMAIWAAIQMFVKPVYKAILYISRSPALYDKRSRVIKRVSFMSAAFLIFLFVIPMPSAVRLEGVVWVPDEAKILAGVDGTIDQLMVSPNEKVIKKQVVGELYDPLLPTEIMVVKAEVKELQQRYSSLRLSDKVDANVVRERLKYSHAELARAKERLNSTQVKSPYDGRIIIPFYEDLKGRYIRKGELLGYVTQNTQPIIRFVVDQQLAHSIKAISGEVEVRFPHDIKSIYSANIIRKSPTAVKDIPSATLTSLGGGNIALDPSVSDKPSALVPVFLYDAKLAQPMDYAYLGQRAYVRVDLGWEPLAFRLYRQVRLAFLRQFDV